MKCKFGLINLVILLLSVCFVVAVPFTPQGNIDMKNVYNITNLTAINSGLYSQVVKNNSGQWNLNLSNMQNLNWTYLQNFPTPCSDGYAVQVINDTLTCTQFIRNNSGAWNINTTEKTASCVVDVNGKGQSTTIQGCIDMISFGDVWIKNGSYLLTSSIEMKSNIRLIGEGDVILNMVAGLTNGINYSVVSPGSLINLTVNASIGDTTITVENGSSFNAGDTILLMNNLTSGGVQTGIWNTIKNMTGNVLALKEALIVNYNTDANSTVQVYNLTKGTAISNLKINGSNNTGIINGIYIRYAYNPIVENVEIMNTGSAGIILDYVYHADIYNNLFHDILRNNTGYSVVPGSATKYIYVHDNTAYNVYEFFDCGGSVIGSSVFLYIYDNSMTNIIESGIDSHGSCSHIYITNNNIKGSLEYGIKGRGNEVHIKGNIVEDTKRQGISHTYSGGWQGAPNSGSYIEDNILIRTATMASNAIYITDVNDVVIVRNTIKDSTNTTPGTASSISVGGTGALAYVQNWTIMYNTIINQKSTGELISIDSNSAMADIEENTWYNYQNFSKPIVGTNASFLDLSTVLFTTSGYARIDDKLKITQRTTPDSVNIGMVDIEASGSGEGATLVFNYKDGTGDANQSMSSIKTYNPDTSEDGPNNVTSIETKTLTAIGSGGHIIISAHDGTEGGEGSEPVEVMNISRIGGSGEVVVTGKLFVSGALSGDINFSYIDNAEFQCGADTFMTNFSASGESSVCTGISDVYLRNDQSDTMDGNLSLTVSNHINLSTTHTTFNEGSSINLYGLTGESKPYLAWYGYDGTLGDITGIGWLGCHYNLSNGDVHSHCSWETLDNSTGTPTLNSHFEISYNNSQKRASVKFPGSDVQFLSNQSLYFGDTKQASIVHNGTSGKLELDANADILFYSHLDMAGNDIENVDDIFSEADIALKPTTTFTVYPSNQTTRGFRVNDDGANISISALGTSNIEIEDAISVTGNVFVSDDVEVEKGNGLRLAGNATVQIYMNSTGSIIITDGTDMITIGGE